METIAHSKNIISPKKIEETIWLDKIADNIEKVIEPFSNKMKLMSMIVLVFMTTVVFVDVVIRNLLDKFVPGIIEIQSFSLVCMFYLIFSFLHHRNEHMKVDLVVKFFPKWIQHLIEGFVQLTTFMFFGLMFWQIIVQSINRLGIISEMLKIPISIFILISALGIFALLVTILVSCLRSFSIIIKDGYGIWIVPVVCASLLFLSSPLIIKSFFNHMDGVTLGLTGMFLLLFLIIVTKMPIGFAMAMIGFLGLIIARDNIQSPLSILGYIPYDSIANFVLAVIPMFVLMGALVSESGVSKGMLEAANTWFGRLPGGLGFSAIIGCAGFSAVCSNSMATAVTMGTVALPEMRKHKYAESLSTGCLAAGGTLGILIPPSMPLIFYGIVTEQSIGKLFMAGVIPGILLTTLFLLAIYIIAIKKPDAAPRGETTTFKEKIESLHGVKGMLFLIILIFGGIMGGIFSPTEAGAIGAIGAFAYGIFIRGLTKKKIIKALESALITSGNLLTIMMGVGILSYFLAATQLPFKLAGIITGFSVNSYLILAVVILMYIILGCFLNIVPMLLLTLPAIYPTITALGFDPIWFGIVLVVVCEMGQITPPIGINVFAIKSIAPDTPIEVIFKGIIPFVAAMLICVLILTLIPQLVTFLPNLLF